jgi:hypothetical protein
MKFRFDETEDRRNSVGKNVVSFGHLMDKHLFIFLFSLPVLLNCIISLNLIISLNFVSFRSVWRKMNSRNTEFHEISNLYCEIAESVDSIARDLAKTIQLEIYF